MQHTSQAGVRLPQPVERAGSIRALLRPQRGFGAPQFRRWDLESSRHHGHSSAVSNVCEHSVRIARVPDTLANTRDDRTCRGRRSPCAVLFLSSTRICLESVIGAPDLGRCRLDVFRETLEHLHCDGAAKHVCRWSVSRLCHHRVGFPAERRAHDIRLYQSGTGKPFERSIDACATLEWSVVTGECFAG